MVAMEVRQWRSREKEEAAKTRALEQDGKVSVRIDYY
jgi:hypothetical protein